MKKIHCCKIYKMSTGLCNQLFSLVSAMIIAIKQKKEIIIVDNFSNDYEEQNFSNISDIIDLCKWNVFLKKNYNIVMVDKNQVTFKINNVKYGAHGKYIDIIDKIIGKFYNNNTITIDKNVDINLLAEEDPVPFVKKEVVVNYSINDYVVEERFEEEYTFLKEAIQFDLSKEEFVYVFHWINTFDKSLFNILLKTIPFTDTFTTLSQNFITNKNIDLNQKINVIHLRIEDDAIAHWSAQNRMERSHFQKTLELKYISLIQKYIKKDEINVILSYSTENCVLDYLKQNGYTYHFTDKIMGAGAGREINALIDLHIGGFCNNIFIGNFNISGLNGSSLSYYLLNKLSDKKVKQVLIDLDDISKKTYTNF